MDGAVTAPPATSSGEDDAPNLEIFLNVLIVLVAGFFLFLVWGLKGIWWPLLWENTVSKMRLQSPRNAYCIAWITSCLCPCCFNRFHPPFRLRLVVHEAWNLRRIDVMNHMECFVEAKCGLNPSKTTAIQSVPLNNRSEPVIWNDAVDLEVQITDEILAIQVHNSAPLLPDQLIGSAHLSVSDEFSRMQGSLEKVKSIERETAKLMWVREDGNLEDAGKIVFSLYATKPQRPLPPVLPGMDVSKHMEFLQDDSASALLS